MEGRAQLKVTRAGAIRLVCAIEVLVYWKSIALRFLNAELLP
jgi:hypothetical protein